MVQPKAGQAGAGPSALRLSEVARAQTIPTTLAEIIRESGKPPV